jgi:hypothetical protein
VAAGLSAPTGRTRARGAGVTAGSEDDLRTISRHGDRLEGYAAGRLGTGRDALSRPALVGGADAPPGADAGGAPARARFRWSPARAARLAIPCHHRWGRELSEAFAATLPLPAATPDLEAIQTLRLLGYRGDPAAEPEIARAAVIPSGVTPVDHALAEALDLLRWRPRWPAS